MKKLEYKLLPCVFCTIGLNSYIVGHNLVHATMQKLFNNAESSTLQEQVNTQKTDTPTSSNINSR
jgi:hypothetical protein